MRTQDPERDGRWCEEHHRHECRRQRSRGRGECHGPAVNGLDVCRMHGGQRAEVLKAKGAAITAWSALAGEATVTSTDAVLGMLQMSWLRAHMYAHLLERQVGDAQEQGEDNWSDDPGIGPGTGLIGHTRGASAGVGVYVTGEAVRGLAQLEAAERDRVVKCAKTAHDMGIADEQVRLIDTYATQVTGLITRILEGLELTPEQQRKVPTIVPRELSRMAG